MSGASSPAPCSCCCLLKGLRWTCRNRASFSSYSIAPHLQTAGKSRGGCPALRFTGVPFPFQVPEVSEGRPGPSHFPGGSRPNTPHHSPTPTPPAPPQASSAPMAVPSVRAVMPKSPMGQAGLGVAPGLQAGDGCVSLVAVELVWLCPSQAPDYCPHPACWVGPVY